MTWLRVALHAWRGRPWWGRGVLWASLLLVAYLSLMPYDGHLLDDQRDKLAHLIVYAALTVLAYLAYQRVAMLWLVAALLVYSVGLEVGQYFVPGRFLSWADVVANTLGLLLGIGCCRAIGKLTRQSQP